MNHFAYRPLVWPLENQHCHLESSELTANSCTYERVDPRVDRPLQNSLIARYGDQLPATPFLAYFDAHFHQEKGGGAD